MTPRIRADGVTKRWADGSGLLPTSFAADPGDLVVVRGRSGTGKSTLLGIIAALCQPDGGAILLDGVPLGPSAPSWNDVTLIPQSLALAVELTLRENIGDANPNVSDDELDRLLAALDLTALAGSTPDTVSTGEQQRCAVGRALITCPLVVLADEPTSHQDAVHADAVVRCLSALTERGATVVIATHDPSLAELATLTVELEL